MAHKQTTYDRWHTRVYQIHRTHDLAVMKPFHARMMDHLSLQRGTKGSVLDVACGKGLFLQELGHRSPKLALSGIDISGVAITSAKKYIKGELRVGDGQNLPYPNASFDYVTCLGGLEYYPDPVKGAQELYRVLKRGGTALIYVPNLMFWGYIWLALRHGAMPTHGGMTDKGEVIYDFTKERFFTYGGWRSILTGAGFNVISDHPYNRIGYTRYSGRLASWVYNALLASLVPKYLSYCFTFVLKK